MGLVLRNLDTKNEITLEEGVPLTIGRGDLAGVSEQVTIHIITVLTQ